MNRQPKALVVGGSLGGLFAGNMLRKAGWGVEIYERSPNSLDSRGGGIVLQPDVVEVFNQVGVDTNSIDLGVMSQHRKVLAPDGGIYKNQIAPQMQTSWSLIYNTMRDAFGDEHYHQGKAVVGVLRDTDSATLVFEDGLSAIGDLVVAADGNNSTVRKLLWPEAEPTYAGYIAWRGLVPELQMPLLARKHLHGDFGFANNSGSHILGYLVPGEGNDTREGRRLYNWVWYRATDDAMLKDVMTDKHGVNRGFSMPEGQLSPQWREHVYREAGELLAPAFKEVVRATEEPFAQAIRDLRVSTMVKGRVVLLGDAAFIPRPHTAASTSKAAANALDLMAALVRHPDSVEQALESWEHNQLTLGEMLYVQGTTVGNNLLFGSPPVTSVG